MAELPYIHLFLPLILVLGAGLLWSFNPVFRSRIFEYWIEKCNHKAFIAQRKANYTRTILGNELQYMNYFETRYQVDEAKVRFARLLTIFWVFAVLADVWLLKPAFKLWYGGTMDSISLGFVMAGYAFIAGGGGIMMAEFFPTFSIFRKRDGELHSLRERVLLLIIGLLIMTSLSALSYALNYNANMARLQISDTQAMFVDEGEQIIALSDSDKKRVHSMSLIATSVTAVTVLLGLGLAITVFELTRSRIRRRVRKLGHQVDSAETRSNLAADKAQRLMLDYTIEQERSGRVAYRHDPIIRFNSKPAAITQSASVMDDEEIDVSSAEEPGTNDLSEIINESADAQELMDEQAERERQEEDLSLI